MRNDQIFTPPYIVNKMLDMVEYYGENIKNKTIFEPSFGDGAFLDKIVLRVLELSRREALDKSTITRILDNIYGIEIDKNLYNKTIIKLNSMLAPCGITYDWPNLICGNALTYKFDKHFDICIGNPPFIRIHDLDKNERKLIEKNYTFHHGNTDMYITFFELGLSSLNSNGKLCYITPNSFLKNSSQKKFRKFLADKNIVKSITDYGAVQVFGKIATYTAITLLHADGKCLDSKYIKMKDKEEEEYQKTVYFSDFHDKPWTVVSKKNDVLVSNVTKNNHKLSDVCNIQYGVATNADKIYLISNERVKEFEPEMIRSAIKGSTLDTSKYIIFPYVWNNETRKFDVIEEDVLKYQYPKTYAYLSMHKEKLDKRDMDRGALWYQYARSQGIQKSNQRKLVIKHVLSIELETCEIVEVDENTIVYSGIFVTCENDDMLNKVKGKLASKNTCKYLKLIGKDMSGGYKSFNTKVLKDLGINIEI